MLDSIGGRQPAGGILGFLGTIIPETQLPRYLGIMHSLVFSKVFDKAQLYITRAILTAVSKGGVHLNKKS